MILAPGQRVSAGLESAHGHLHAIRVEGQAVLHLIAEGDAIGLVVGHVIRQRRRQLERHRVADVIVGAVLPVALGGISGIVDVGDLLHQVRHGGLGVAHHEQGLVHGIDVRTGYRAVGGNGEGDIRRQLVARGRLALVQGVAHAGGQANNLMGLVGGIPLDLLAVELHNRAARVQNLEVCAGQLVRAGSGLLADLDHGLGIGDSDLAIGQCADHGGIAGNGQLLHAVDDILAFLLQG